MNPNTTTSSYLGPNQGSENPASEPAGIYLFNTLRKEKEIFKPLKNGHVSMYHCGPTVYNFAHIGNLRAFVATDILRRVFEYNNYSVSQVMNITDIGHLQSDRDDGDDKMTLALRRENLPLTLDAMKMVANKYYDAFRHDLEEINILPAHHFPFASDHIEEDKIFIKNLLENDHVYKTDNGLYFDTNSIRDYGMLGGVSNENDSANVESRLKGSEDSDGANPDAPILSTNQKKNFRDFAVWKFNDELGYDAEFGKGFPGWHIECSVMSMKYLGDTFDIHTGGIDHIPVHHNNEIAQSEAKSGKLLANYWLHNEHLIIEGGKKMAKSGETFFTLSTLEENGTSPIAYRYWVLGASYRSQLQFSFDALKQAEQAYRNLVGRVAEQLARSGGAESSANTNAVAEKFELTVSEDTDQEATHISEWSSRFLERVNDDLDTAGGLAILQTLLKNSEMTPETKIKLISSFDEVLGLKLVESAQEKIKNDENATNSIPDSVRALAEKRVVAKRDKDWIKADEIRDEIQSAGYLVRDEGEEYILSPLS